MSLGYFEMSARADYMREAVSRETCKGNCKLPARLIDMLGTPFATTLTKSATQRCKPRAKLPQSYTHRLPSPHLPSHSLARILRPRHQRKLRASLPLSTTLAGTLLATKSHNSICTEQESRQRYTSTCPLLVKNATGYLLHEPSTTVRPCLSWTFRSVHQVVQLFLEKWLPYEALLAPLLDKDGFNGKSPRNFCVLIAFCLDFSYSFVICPNLSLFLPL